jgi:thiol-disulfide isomerase/thioredoxin
MPLEDLDSPEAVEAFKSQNAGGALICFSATWCGPCKASKPQLEALAASYDADGGAVAVGIAYEHNLGDAVHAASVRAFPTYVLYVRRTEKGRVEGVNFDGIRAMVSKAGCKKEWGGGQGLGGGGAGGQRSVEDARAARLARLGAAPAPAPAPATDPAETPKDVEMKDAAADECVVVEEPEMVDPAANLSKESIESLSSSMGFSIVRAQKGLLKGGGTVEGAIEWLMQHQDDVDIDEPIALVPKSASAAIAQSYRCNDCGKILSNMANLELHANKTGHSDFEESTVAVKPLTAEEKKAKVLELKALLKAKRAEREEAEKVEDIDREKQRRSMGKQVIKTREEMEREARKREARMRKKEKEDERRERERLRAEIARDKLERAANRGKLQSTLGAEGYNPSVGKQYETGGDPAPPMRVSKADPKKIDDYIKKVSSYRAGGDGGKCLKVLTAYVSNVVDKPDEEKYRTINMENKAFKGKVKPLIGGKALLLAVGFKPNDAGNALVLSEDADRDALKQAKAKLEEAYAAYAK